MSNTERIYQIDQILSGRQFVPRVELQAKLGVSWATLKRDLNYLKDRLHAPIIFDREVGGYRFDSDTKRVGPQYELPGLWFSAEEIHALLTMQHLLTNLDSGGLLGPHCLEQDAQRVALDGLDDDKHHLVRGCERGRRGRVLADRGDGHEERLDVLDPRVVGRGGLARQLEQLGSVALPHVGGDGLVGEPAPVPAANELLDDGGPEGAHAVV